MSERVSLEGPVELIEGKLTFRKCMLSDYRLLNAVFAHADKDGATV